MKFLKYFFFLLLIGIIALAIYIAVQPNNFKVERTVTMKAPAEMIYKNVSDYKNWEAWSSWVEADPDMKITLPEQTSGVGSSYSWEDKDGVGTMKTLDAVPNTSLTQQMQFADFPPSDIHWKFKPHTDGSTEVTWSIAGKDLPFGFKAFVALSGGMEKQIGPHYDRSLAKLDSLMTIEMEAKVNEQKAFRLGTIEEVVLAPQKFIGYYQKTSTDVDHEKMTSLFMEFMPKAGAYAMSKLAPEELIPGTVYTKWDETTKEAEFYIGVLLKKDLAPAEGMTSINLPRGKSLKVAKYGNYGTGDYEAHTAIGKYMQENELSQNGTTIWELYVNDPTTVKPEEIQTDIYYPVK
jgi:effector-binding domain-containing protein/uncharacterized protein YndB with AHSA1/START domain